MPVSAGELGELIFAVRRAPSCTGTTASSRARTFMGEWTRSGDKYREDEDGYYVYCGRNDDMLKVSGLYVSPFEVEAALQSHAAVLECAVVAWLDDDDLTKPKAFVVLKSVEAGNAGDGACFAGTREGRACTVQISALDRVPRRIAQDRDRQNSALQIAGRAVGRIMVS